MTLISTSVLLQFTSLFGWQVITASVPASPGAGPDDGDMEHQSFCVSACHPTVPRSLTLLESFGLPSAPKAIEVGNTSNQSAWDELDEPEEEDEEDEEDEEELLELLELLDEEASGVWVTSRVSVASSINVPREVNAYPVTRLSRVVPSSFFWNVTSKFSWSFPVSGEIDTHFPEGNCAAKSSGIFHP